MTRRSLFFLVCIFVLISSCSLFDDSSAEAAEAFAPDANTSLAGDYHFTELDVPAGVEISLSGDTKIQVDGNVQIAGVVQGDCTSFELRSGGDLALVGQIDTSCSGSEAGPEIRLVVGGLAAIGTEGDGAPAIVSGGDILIADTEGENLDLSQVVSEAEEALMLPSLSIRQSSPPRSLHPTAQLGRTCRMRPSVTRPVTAANPGARSVLRPPMGPWWSILV